MNKITFNVTLVGIVFGLIGTFLTVTYQDNSSKRDITLKTIEIINQKFMAEQPILLRDSSNIDEILQQKENAFITGVLTQHLVTNYEHIDFRSLQAALTYLQRRYSYAQIYRAAGLGTVVCESLTLNLHDRERLEISSDLSKCVKSDLEGIALTLLNIEQENYRFEIKISGDSKKIICPKESCSFWVDLGDRLESTAYEFLFLTEYIGFDDVYNKLNPVISFSIIKRFTEQVSAGCKPFFDSNPLTLGQPQLPDLDDFGESIIRACGSIGGNVSEEEFVALLDEYLDELIPYFPISWANLSKLEMTSKLKQIWTKYNGFNHVFCGEWNQGKIGGLHYSGRYVQLQEEKEACYIESPVEEVIDEHIYTIGVASADGLFVNLKKGYALQQSAKELFALGVSAIETCKSINKDWKPYGETFDKLFYIKALSDKNKIDYQIICKTSDPNDLDDLGILTIYPDATPSE